MQLNDIDKIILYVPTSDLLKFIIIIWFMSVNYKIIIYLYLLIYIFYFGYLSMKKLSRCARKFKLVKEKPKVGNCFSNQSHNR